MQQTEAAFMAQIKQAADLLGWLHYHCHDSRRSDPGMPDLILCRPPRVVFAELKIKKGRLRYYQALWLAKLEACPGVECYEWRPSDWERIEGVLV